MFFFFIFSLFFFFFVNINASIIVAFCLSVSSHPSCFVRRMVLALKSSEDSQAGTQQTFVTLLERIGEKGGAEEWKVRLPETLVPTGFKFEGLEFALREKGRENETWQEDGPGGGGEREIEERAGGRRKGRGNLEQLGGAH